MKKTITMPSGNGKGELKLDLVLDEELGDKCGLYAKVTIPAGSTLGYHEHHGEGESYFILSGEAVYDDNGTNWTPSGSGHGVDNSAGSEDLVFMALIVKQ